MGGGIKRNCWTCKFGEKPGRCTASIEARDAAWPWIKRQYWSGGRPHRDADGCLGWEAKGAPPNTARATTEG